MSLFKKLTNTFKVNKSNRVMVQCRASVDSNAIRYETRGGVEHIILTSATLPDNIVMNDGLYPEEVVAASFETLERTHAPIEHPQIQGQYISATDPLADDFLVGAYNENVRKKNGRIYLDKVIDVSKAVETDKGKRLLDRIQALKNNTNAEPIHTSVGVYLVQEPLDKPQVNAMGQKYSWIARDLVFDHDAILLDSEGAATPEQGVGIAVNKKGQELQVLQTNIDESNLNYSAIKALNDASIEFNAIESVDSDRVQFWLKGQLYEAPFSENDDGVSIQTEPQEVNAESDENLTINEGDKMKALIINALQDAGITAEGLSDEQLLEAHNQLVANKSKSDNTGDNLAEIVANAVAEQIKGLTEQVEGLAAKNSIMQETELSNLAEIVANSEKYPGMDVDSAKLLGVEKLRELAANCQTSFGVSPVINNGSFETNVPQEMPE